MLDVSEVERISAQEEDEEILVEVLEKQVSFSWLTTQFVICLILVATLIAIKEYFPDIYNSLFTEYREIADKTLLIKDGEINILPEFFG